MQVIENATHLKARLLDKAADPARPGWLRVTVEVTHTAPAGDLPSLIQAAAGESLAVLVGPEDRAAVDALPAGADVAMQVRLRAPGVHTAVPGSVTAG